MLFLVLESQMNKRPNFEQKQNIQRDNISLKMIIRFFTEYLHHYWISIFLNIPSSIFNKCSSLSEMNSKFIFRQKCQNIFQSIRKFILQMLAFLLIQYFLLTTMSFVFKPAWQNQGKGARVIRIIGNQYLRNLDPFLMLDYFKVRLPAGFPDHPHRGFETVTYMLQGSFYHQDFKGHKGKIGPGDLQWMTAGRGIVHSQIPASYQEDSLGFQLWINLRSANKMDPPAYQEFTSDKIEVFNKDKVQVKIIAGKWQGKTGPIYARTPAYYFDVHVQAGGKFDLPIPGNWNSIIFAYEGDVIYQGKTLVQKEHCCVLQKGKNNDEIAHSFVSKKGAKFVLIGGQPLNEPIQQHGPFVLNTKQQIYKAFSDYQNGVNGFENADNWQSKIKDLMTGKKFEDL